MDGMAGHTLNTSKWTVRKWPTYTVAVSVVAGSAI
jgi:hypothetical protein